MEQITEWPEEVVRDIKARYPLSYCTCHGGWPCRPHQYVLEERDRCAALVESFSPSDPYGITSFRRDAAAQIREVPRGSP